MKQLVSIVVPLLDSEENQPNNWSTDLLFFSLDILKNNDIIWITGESKTLPEWTKQYPDALTYRFEDRYFTGPDTLTRLLLSKQFYDRFDWCEFIFLLDHKTWVVKDELTYWCKQGYDFIQPAKSPKMNLVGKYFNSTAGISIDDDNRSFSSLRRVDRLMKVTQRKSAKALNYCNNFEIKPKSDWCFWETNTHPWKSDLRIPTPVNRNRFGLFSDNVSFTDSKTDSSFIVTDVAENQWAALKINLK